MMLISFVFPAIDSYDYITVQFPKYSTVLIVVRSVCVCNKILNSFFLLADLGFWRAQKCDLNDETPHSVI